MGYTQVEDRERTARIVRLRDHESLSWRQIAKREGVTHQRIKQIYYRGIHRKEQQQ